MKSIFEPSTSKSQQSLMAQFVHPFFGTMNKEQIGLLNFKHVDRHLRQFGV